MGNSSFSLQLDKVKAMCTFGPFQSGEVNLDRLLPVPGSMFFRNGLPMEDPFCLHVR
jgi:hypothetical protein